MTSVLTAVERAVLPPCRSCGAAFASCDADLYLRGPRCCPACDHGDSGRGVEHLAALALRNDERDTRAAGRAEAGVQRVGRNAVKALRRSGKGLTGTELCRAIAHRDRDLLVGALQHLVDDGRITAEKLTADEHGGGGAGVRYRASADKK